jgi:hypothetical protein
MGRREVVLREGAEEYVKRLYDLRCDEIKKIDTDAERSTHSVTSKPRSACCGDQYM